MNNKELTEGLTGGLTEGSSRFPKLELDIYEQYLPKSGWKILEVFAYYNKELTIRNIQRGLNYEYHENTLREMIRRLQEKSLIRKCGSNRGLSKSSNVYIITTDGIKVFDKYRNKEI